MIGLMTSGAYSATEASAAVERASHSGSRVSRSRKIFVSTSTVATREFLDAASLAASESHQLVCGHGQRGHAARALAQAFDEGFAPCRPFHRTSARCFFQNHDLISHDKAHLGVRLNAELVSDFDGNRDLAFAGDTHELQFLRDKVIPYSDASRSASWKTGELSQKIHNLLIFQRWIGNTA